MLERKQLFNGRDLSGWEMVGPGAFRLEDDTLVTEGGMGLLWYTGEKIGNAVLRAVYSVSRVEDNSGVFIRIADRPPDPWFAVHNGYEVQILATANEWHRTGCIYSLAPALAEAQKAPGEWNTMDIALDGDLVRVTLNDVLVCNFDPSQSVPEREYQWEPERGPREAYGYIGLQNHDKDSRVSFREVSVGPIDEEKTS
jgi:hypothetical protein